jgi:hypothetical protein
LTGRQSAKEWKEMHRGEFTEVGGAGVIDPKGGRAETAIGGSSPEEPDPPRS